MKLSKLAALSAIIFTAAHCNNLGLLDKLANPGGINSSQGPMIPRLYAFVVPVITLPDMTNLVNGGCTGNGIPRADCSCQDYAIAGGLQRTQSGIFKAWLSDATNDMTCRMQGISNNNCALPSGTYTWFNTMDEPLANSYADLFDSNLASGLKYSHQKNLVSGNVWTGTDGGGLRSNAGVAQSNCTNWQNTATSTPSVIVGTIGSTDVNWTNNAVPVNSCSQTHYVYCFAIP